MRIIGGRTGTKSSGFQKEVRFVGNGKKICFLLGAGAENDCDLPVGEDFAGEVLLADDDLLKIVADYYKKKYEEIYKPLKEWYSKPEKMNIESQLGSLLYESAWKKLLSGDEETGADHKGVSEKKNSGESKKDFEVYFPNP